MKLYNLNVFVVAGLVACQGNGNADTENVNRTPGNEPVYETENVHFDMKLLPIDNADLPVECDFAGYLIDSWKWEDANGSNFVLRSVEEPVDDMEEDPEAYQVMDQYLHVYHYVKGKDGKVRLLRKLTDFEKDCDFDLTVSHIEQIDLSDLDGDNKGELVFGYRLACRSDVSPSTQKVVVFEDGDKYILRGTTLVMGYGGEFKAGEEFDKAHEGFLQTAKNYWEANKTEFEVSE